MGCSDSQTHDFPMKMHQQMIISIDLALKQEEEDEIVSSG